jgi:UDP-glucose 4-epimerase
VREVLDTMEEVAGRKLNIWSSLRRPGDPPALVADATRIRKVLGWCPQHNDLRKIV